jgi:hypothetical protein
MIKQGDVALYKDHCKHPHINPSLFLFLIQLLTTKCLLLFGKHMKQVSDHIGYNAKQQILNNSWIFLDLSLELVRS